MFSAAYGAAVKARVAFLSVTSAGVVAVYVAAAAARMDTIKAK